MARKGNQVTVKLEGIEGNTTAAGGSVTQGAPATGHPSQGGNVVNLDAKNITGDTIVAGGDVVTLFDSRLADLRAELLRAYAHNEQARARIIDLTDDLAAEAQQPPAARDAGRAQRLMGRLEQLALDVGAKVASGLLIEAAKGVFLS